MTPKRPPHHATRVKQFEHSTHYSQNNTCNLAQFMSSTYHATKTKRERKKNLKTRQKQVNVYSETDPRKANEPTNNIKTTSNHQPKQSDWRLTTDVLIVGKRSKWHIKRKTMHARQRWRERRRHKVISVSRRWIVRFVSARLKITKLHGLLILVKQLRSEGIRNTVGLQHCSKSSLVLIYVFVRCRRVDMFVRRRVFSTLHSDLATIVSSRPCHFTSCQNLSFKRQLRLFTLIILVSIIIRTLVYSYIFLLLYLLVDNERLRMRIFNEQTPNNFLSANTIAFGMLLLQFLYARVLPLSCRQGARMRGWQVCSAHHC